MDIMKGWGDVAIMLGAFGAEIDREIDEATDLVVQGDNTDDKVKSEAAKWNVPIIGVNEIKRVIRGLLNARLILASSKLTRQEKEEALKHVGGVSSGEDNVTPTTASEETHEERASQTTWGEACLLDNSNGEGQQLASVPEDANMTG